jgi:hypothetical protein
MVDFSRYQTYLTVTFYSLHIATAAFFRKSYVHHLVLPVWFLFICQQWVFVSSVKDTYRTFFLFFEIQILKTFFTSRNAFSTSSFTASIAFVLDSFSGTPANYEVSFCSLLLRRPTLLSYFNLSLFVCILRTSSLSYASLDCFLTAFSGHSLDPYMYFILVNYVFFHFYAFLSFLTPSLLHDSWSV